ncbi:MAG TPA: hypothetical protein V6D12_21500 [Candidatus Obscuribacterales bacterium]
MHKVYQFCGYFLIGVSSVGLFSYTAVAFPNMAAFTFWISVVASIMLIVAGLADEFLAQWLGLGYYQYIGLVISLVAIALIGGLLQWVR